MDAARLWCHVIVVGPDGVRGEAAALGGRGFPDLDTVDAVARWALAASRAGGRLILSDVSPELHDLLRLVGLPPGAAEDGEWPGCAGHSP